MITMTESQNVQTDLVIQAGQVVVVSGDPVLVQAPSWGSGGFTVQQYGSLSLTGVALNSLPALQTGGIYSLNSVSFRGGTHAVTGRAGWNGRGIHFSPASFLLDALVKWSSNGQPMIWNDNFGGCNAIGNQYELYQLPAVTFVCSAPMTSAGVCNACCVDYPSEQLYADLCAGVGLRPVVSGSTDYGAPDYCAAYNCMQTADFANSFWGALSTATGGWGDAGSPGFVAFDVHDGANGGGGLRRSASESGWNQPLIPVCGREL